MRALIYISFLIFIANTNLFSQTELINSIRKLNTENAIKLINNGANVNEYLSHKKNHKHTDKCINHDYNRNPLFWSVLRGEYNITKLLIEHGADINFSNAGGKTALIIAVQKYDYKILSLLINAGADLNIKDNNDNTALLIAAKNYTLEINQEVKTEIKNIIKLLLENNAEINTLNAQNTKPTDFKIINELLKNHSL